MLGQDWPRLCEAVTKPDFRKVYLRAVVVLSVSLDRLSLRASLRITIAPSRRSNSISKCILNPVVGEWDSRVFDGERIDSARDAPWTHTGVSKSRMPAISDSKVQITKDQR